MSPALQGRFSTTGPPGKSLGCIFIFTKFPGKLQNTLQSEMARWTTLEEPQNFCLLCLHHNWVISQIIPSSGTIRLEPNLKEVYLLRRAVNIFSVTAVYHKGMSLRTQSLAFGGCFLKSMLQKATKGKENEINDMSRSYTQLKTAKGIPLLWSRTGQEFN